MKWFNVSLTELSVEELLEWSGGYGMPTGTGTNGKESWYGNPSSAGRKPRVQVDFGANAARKGILKPKIPVRIRGNIDPSIKVRHLALVAYGQTTIPGQTYGQTTIPGQGLAPVPGGGAKIDLKPPPVRETIPKIPSPGGTPSSHVDPISVTEIGQALDRVLPNSGYCFAASLLNQYALNGVHITFQDALAIMKTAQKTTVAWNGKPVLGRDGMVNHPDVLLQIAASHLNQTQLSTGDKKYSGSQLALTHTLSTGNSVSSLRVGNAQGVINTFRETHFAGRCHEVQGLVLELRKNGRTHFVSVNQWDLSTLTDPHGGHSRHDWEIAGLRVIT